MSFNAFWYLGLTALSLALLTFMFYKKRNNRTLIQFLVVIEIAYLIEAVIYVFLGSYTYHPKLIKHNAYYDSHMGALASNLITIPVLATFISVFQLGWGWIISCIGFLAAIEWLFVKLQIYTLHWWRIEYTALGLLIYFPLTKMLYRRVLHPFHGILHSVFLFLCIAPISGTLQFLPFMFFSNREYIPGWYKDLYVDTSAFGDVYYVCESLFLVFMTKRKWTHRWLKYAVTALFFAAVTVILKKVGILHSYVWWDPWVYILYPLAILKFAEVIGERLSSSPIPPPSQKQS
ncbi:hypothetical protein [Paenibacillus hamazuiensis]|uniref:hypothetical protein n=1 Tax=Paenibacillus hamazuiensis TaxID=2936508 RepID=UPI00200DAB8B|nr:hypothetical protein [Paenibacillus hamazuiensis]